MGAGTTITWENQSTTSTTTTTTDDSTLFLQAFSSDKGPEDLRIVTSDTFEKLYGTSFSFAKHGQPLLTAKRIIDGGGKLLAKRIVADDATFSNLIVMAKVTKTSVQKVNSLGKLIYKDADGKEYAADTIDAADITAGTYSAVMIDVANITYTVGSVASVTKLSTLTTQMATATHVDGSTTYYNLFAIADIGRGKCGKRAKIVFRSSNSKSQKQAIYALSDVENSVAVDTGLFTLDSDVLFNGKSYGLSSETNQQFHVDFSEVGYAAFIAKVAEITGFEEDYLKMHDLLNGNTYSNVAIQEIVITDDSADFSYDYGLELQNGSDGTAFEYGGTKYNAALLALYDGTFTKNIYNTDVYKLDVVMDANFPFAVKNAIIKLLEFRKDAFFFADLGLEIYDYDDVVAAVANLTASKFVAPYSTVYKVADPSNKKPIKVSMIYSLVDAVIAHFSTGRHLPFAGKNITDIITGTVQFEPCVIPGLDQKALMEQVRVNYGIYINENTFMIETMNTNREVDGQLNYIQNVLAVQHVIKDIRTFCPANRYKYNYSPNFSTYANMVTEGVLEQHMTNFAALGFAYTSEKDEMATGEFDASLTFSFNAHIQSENFTIYAED